MQDRARWKIDRGFDLDGFLARPVLARIATAGPTVRPVWYVWEDEAFWWLTGGWSQLTAILSQNPEVVALVDTCDLASGEVLQVVAAGTAEIAPFDEDRARRKLRRYLGDDESGWDRRRFLEGTFDDPTVRFIRLAPRTLRARDLSYPPAP